MSAVVKMAFRQTIHSTEQKFEHFAELPADIQRILIETAQENQAYVYDLAAQLEIDLLGKLKDGGITANTADKDAFIAASQPIYEEFASTVDGGADLIETVQGLAN